MTYIETEHKADRVLIAGVQTDDYSDELFDLLMDEMVELTETAGGLVVDVMRQKLGRLNARSAFGSGKVQEMTAKVDQEEVDLVVVLNALTPSMNAYLEKTCQARVIDRVQLILDIFAMRAKSREGKLQVELAQYEYLLPRLSGRGIEMSRLGGGIGTRGPGETQLETDRRHIRSRITTIKRELDKVGSHRERTRERRFHSQDYTIGLMGYTNAGKSTLLNQLTDAGAYVQDQLFATLDPLTRKMSIDGHDLFTLTDTVGFIEELPTELIQAFKSTLEEIADVDLLLHVVDASSSARLMQEATVNQLLHDLDMDQIPVLTVYNKKDLLEDQNFGPTLFPNILVSAYDAEDMQALKAKILHQIKALSHYYLKELRTDQGRELALLQENTLVENVEFDEVKAVYRISGYEKPTERS